MARSSASQAQGRTSCLLDHAYWTMMWQASHQCTDERTDLSIDSDFELVLAVAEV